MKAKRLSAIQDDNPELDLTKIKSTEQDKSKPSTNWRDQDKLFKRELTKAKLKK